jgi:hypothetical protein
MLCAIGGVEDHVHMYLRRVAGTSHTLGGMGKLL